MVANPLALIAEVTYRCPLHCVYCSNPLEIPGSKSELSTQDWLRVFREAGNMHVLHVHLTGGEPLGRPDLEELVAGAQSAGLYTNLITSGIGLSEPRLAKLVQTGLNHIQLSFQDSRETAGDWISGARVHARKVELARLIRRHKIAFTINLVVHRHNLDHIEEMIEFFEKLAPDRMEIAHAQYYGWALRNRSALLPTREQLDNSHKAIAAAQKRLEGRMRVDWVTPDYYARYPKPCMGGWGRTLMLVDPSGNALPCHAAAVIPGIQFANVREQSLDWIWQESAAFQKFRGEAWMLEPCLSCNRRLEDYGGCRCQAFLLAGDARATDPVCSLAPQRSLVDEIVKAVNFGSADIFHSLEPSHERREKPLPGSWSYRTNPE